MPSILPAAPAAAQPHQVAAVDEQVAVDTRLAAL